MKRLVITVALMLTLASFAFPVAFAKAEAANQEGQATTWEIGEEESFADYFQRVWLDKIAGYVCVLLGAVSAVAVTVAKVKKAHDALVTDGAKLREEQKNLSETQSELAETREIFLRETEAMKEALGQVVTAQERMQNTYQSAYGTLDNLRKAVLVGFCNDGELVRTGYAKEVARLLEGDDEE